MNVYEQEGSLEHRRFRADDRDSMDSFKYIIPLDHVARTQFPQRPREPCSEQNQADDPK
jgi:hypothetical protein